MFKSFAACYCQIQFVLPVYAGAGEISGQARRHQLNKAMRGAPSASYRSARSNANALVRSPALARTPGKGSSPKRFVMNFNIEVVSAGV